MNKSRLLLPALFLLIIFLSASVCFGLTNTWDGSESTDWFAAGNWSDGVPDTGHHVVITNAVNEVLLTNSTASLASFNIISNTLTFTNWTTALTALNVTIWGGGTVTVANAFSNSPAMSNRVYIVCTNFTLDTGGTIDANANGYAGNNGPGKGGDAGSIGGGGSYGGMGGGIYSTATGGPTYGSSNAPVEPGSGGGGYSGGVGTGGHGGGAVRIEAAGTVTVNGTITANGGNYTASWGGGGSGGGIYITCDTFGGSNGVLYAKGGTGHTGNESGGGGGGRIAVVYNSLAGQPSVRFETTPGSGYSTAYRGKMGTLYLSDSSMLSETPMETFMNVQLFIPGFTNWSPGNLTISNSAIWFQYLLKLNVGSNLVIGTGGELTMNGNLELTCGEDLIVTNGGILVIRSGGTNGLAVDYGALVDVTGDVRIASSSWIYPYSSTNDGGSVLFRMNNLGIAEDGGFDADAGGYGGGQGLGKGHDAGVIGGGGGYGGMGGGAYSSATGGVTYGSANAPVEPGSGGGGHASGSAMGGYGGGAVRIEAAGSVTLNGTISANGDDGNNAGNYGGGGSGGGIFITCETFGGGANGVLCARGGNGHTGNQTGGGGGGRIAVGIGLSEEARNKLLAGQEVSRLYTYENHADFAGSVSVTNGTGWNSPSAYDGEPGTKMFMTTNYCLTITGNPANYDSPVPHGYGIHPYMADNTEITNTVSSPVDEGGGLRRACIGWATAVSNSTSTQAVFQLTTNLVLTWNWTNEYELTVSSGNTNRGTVSTNVNGWYTNGVVVPGISATGTNEYQFLQWTGDVPSGQETNRPLSVTMDQARTITAQFYSLSGETKTWAGSGSWGSATNWSPEGMPGPNDDAIIRSGNVLLDFSTSIKFLMVSNSATLTFTNWDTTLTASDVMIESGGELTLPSVFTESQMSNRVHIVCANLTLATNGTINADSKGYAGHEGPGKGGDAGSIGGGGSYGGMGGGIYSTATGGPTYGSSNAPVEPGSGGGGYSGGPKGGHGGGAVRIEATGTVTVNGTITANGGNYTASYGGGGSGGGIYITCDTFGGSNGVLYAKGGNGHPSNEDGGGGGGRIAVWYGVLESERQRIIDGDMNRVSIITNASDYSDFSGAVSVTNGIGYNSAYDGEPGTLIFLTVTPPSGTMFMCQ